MTKTRPVFVALWAIAILMLRCIDAHAIDFYEIQIYTVDTTAQRHLQVELHSNTVNTATGSLAHQQLRPYEIHETIEATYGLLPHLEIGQYFATAKLDNGRYEYAGSRTKLHFGLGDPELLPVAVGANFELAYMRRAAEENPLSFEIRPIIEKRKGRFWIVANLAVEKPFSGPGTHKGATFAPSGEISYQVLHWLAPALEYYGDMGAFEHFPGVQQQQHFVVPTINLDLDPRLELNFGVGLGLTQASNGVFVKSIVGWTF